MVMRLAKSALLCLLLIGAAPAPSHADAAALKASVSVDFASSKGPRLQVERMNNLSRARTFPEQRDADVAFFNEQGLHGQIYRVWVDAERIYDPNTGAYNYDEINDYLADVSRLSDSLLVVMDTRVSIRDLKRTPEQIKPIIKTIMRELKQRFAQIRYIEANNEPDHNLNKVMKPEGFYDYYRVYYEAVNEINRELKPKVPLEVGGPALGSYGSPLAPVGGENLPWLPIFLDSYAADKSPDKRLDFISYHTYGYFTPERSYHFIGSDPSEVAKCREQLDEMLRSRGLDTKTPLFITELGNYPGPSFDDKNDPRPDYLRQAAGAASLLYWFMEQPRTVPFNWVLRHFSEERKDQLITRAGEGKPVPTRTFTPYGNTLLMMSKLKVERVAARSNALANGKGIYAVATRDDGGTAVMVWNYQKAGTQVYQVTIDMGELPVSLRGKSLRQRMFRIDDTTSNYWGDPARANLQQISETTIKPGKQHSVTVDLSANALQLVVLELDSSLVK